MENRLEAVSVTAAFPLRAVLSAAEREQFDSATDRELLRSFLLFSSRRQNREEAETAAEREHPDFATDRELLSGSPFLFLLADKNGEKQVYFRRPFGIAVPRAKITQQTPTE